MHHDGVVVDDAVIPDIAVNLLFGENPVCVGHKIFHEESLFAGQGDLLPVFVELHLVADVPEHAGGEDGGAGGGSQGDPPQAGLHFGAQHHGAEWLGDVVVGADAQGQHLVRLRLPPAEDEDGGENPVGPQVTDHLEAVHILHDQVQDDQGIFALLRHMYGLDSSGRLLRGEALRPQNPADNAPDGGVVVNYQYVLLLCHRPIPFLTKSLRHIKYSTSGRQNQHCGLTLQKFKVR